MGENISWPTCRHPARHFAGQMESEANIPFKNYFNVLPFIILTSKICPKMSFEISFSFSTYCFPMGQIVVQLFVANLINSSYLESYLLAETIKTLPGIAIIGDKKPWTRKHSAQTERNRLLQRYLIKKLVKPLTNKRFLPVKNDIIIFKTVLKHCNWFYLAIINNKLYFLF